MDGRDKGVLQVIAQAGVNLLLTGRVSATIILNYKLDWMLSYLHIIFH
jgi:hypothetical protein